MLRRVESEPSREPRLSAHALDPAVPLAVPSIGDMDLDPQLPPDHPPWAKDALSISTRARELLARLRPLALRVLTFWDHARRQIVVGGNRVSVDASGSYRVDRE